MKKDDEIKELEERENEINKKLKELMDLKTINLQNGTEDKTNNDSGMILWIMVVLLALAGPNFSNQNNKINRKELIKIVDDSDLNNSEKKRIIEILLG